MSQENVEIARRYLEEHFPGPEQLSEWVAGFWESDGDYYPARKIPGCEAMPRARGDRGLPYGVPCSLGGLALRHKEARAIGDDRVLVHGGLRVEGRASGATLEGDVYSCFWLRNGRFFRVEGHLTLAGALNALGLTGDALEAAGLRE